jgi:hypothetical protein
MNADSNAALGPNENPGPDVHAFVSKRLRKLRRERRLIDRAIVSLMEIARVRQTRYRRPIGGDSRISGA